jgi:hypothetical protein
MPHKFCKANGLTLTLHLIARGGGGSARTKGGRKRRCSPATSPLPTPTTPCSLQSLAPTIHLPSSPPPSPTMEEGARHAPKNEAANADADISDLQGPAQSLKARAAEPLKPEPGRALGTALDGSRLSSGIPQARAEP